jgi:hypothetical protein
LKQPGNTSLKLWRIEIMLKVTKPGKPVMVRTYGDNLLAHVCLDLAGGGYTTKQTIEAMTTQAALERDGIVKTRRYTIERIADDSPDMARMFDDAYDEQCRNACGL